MIIYKATNLINGKIYIGQTIHSLSKRKNQHERAHRYPSHNCSPFDLAIKKYGKENFKWEIIDTAETIEEIYESAVLASIDISGNKNNAGNIHKVCNNERRTALKYHWEFC